MPVAAFRRMSFTRDSEHHKLPTANLEMWGGLECTVNRVRDRYHQQMLRNGHASRADDIDRFASLGIKALRYPVLWELVAPEHSAGPDWSWPDQRLSRLRSHGIRPIVGLVHHGSGPRHTSLIDGDFPTKLAAYARMVAERYPWVTDYTPVNEPLTTARFSGLYGHWYPHGRHGETFARALVNQCRAVVLAMHAIREVTPGAHLVQTEDLGRIFSTHRLAYEAEFQNQRRWLSLDLLCGRVDAQHPLWGCLLKWGLSEADILWFQEHRCPPDIVGINHYLTSDRFLDEKSSLYPRSRLGGNQHEEFADVEAVRAGLHFPVGTCSVLREAWDRFKLPLAVTEAHLGATREDQLRWLYEVWDGAQRLRRAGVDVRAVTAWSLLGAFDWNNLVTVDEGYYESGVFDIRSPQPRPTALARLVRDLATLGYPQDEPLLRGPGWWRRADRLFQPHAEGRAYPHSKVTPTVDMADVSFRPLLIIGGTGTLGRALIRLCDIRGIPYHVLDRRDVDLTGAFSFDRLLDERNPWAVINAAGYVRVDDAEDDEQTCMRVNATAPAEIAQACARQEIPLVLFSSDLVFDGGDRTVPYTEGSAVGPLNVYGRSKADMEQAVSIAFPDALIIRTSAFFDPWWDANFVTQTLQNLQRGGTVMAAVDQVVSPTYVPDLVHTTLDLLIDHEKGIWHLANQGAVSWSTLADMASEAAGVATGRIEACATVALNQRARRPSYSALASERGWLLPSLENALGRYMDQRVEGTRRARRMTRRQRLRDIAAHAPR